eukprot:jgi/Mesvir1/4484/Mv14581-RA.1
MALLLVSLGHPATSIGAKYRSQGFASTAKCQVQLTHSVQHSAPLGFSPGHVHLGWAKHAKGLVPLASFLGSVVASSSIAHAAVDPSYWTGSLDVEPTNALSLPTWIIHTSSVLEWVTATFLLWEFGTLPGNEAYKGLAWAMLPSLGAALCALTWHFFYNAEDMAFLVACQGLLTVLGNCTLWLGAYRIYKRATKE